MHAIDLTPHQRQLLISGLKKELSLLHARRVEYRAARLATDINWEIVQAESLLAKLKGEQD